jgi:tetrapyrrole methylase family protein/MazG family protein
MNAPGIKLLGLGPGSSELLTRSAWRTLQKCTEIYLRTRHHPVVADLPQHLTLHSFDHLYEENDEFEQVYAQIVERVLKLGRRPGGVVYAVPGHPFIAEATAPEIARRARSEGLPVEIIEGMSFLEPVFRSIRLDPFPKIVLLDALELALLHMPPYPSDSPAIIAQIYSRLVASEVKLALMTTYPDEHPVKLVHAAGTADEQIEELSLYEIDRSEHIGLLTALYVPPLPDAVSFEAFQEVVAHLRAPDGCPWDREQTHQSLRSGLMEETYEALSAIDADNPAGMCEEFGDLLLLIVMHAQIANEYGEFTMADLIHGIYTKIVNRHPHVFDNLELQDTRDVLENWERLKEQERAINGNSEASLLDGVAQALPALLQAEQYQSRAARVGFDWPEIQGVWDKLMEEIDEVRNAADLKARSDELGDLLFAAVNLARWYQVEPESALREANGRFRARFSQVEAGARRRGLNVADLSLDEMEALWQKAKQG